jgi:hypothetical protein
MRTTRGKPTLERVLLGDVDLAGRMADALATEDRDDRVTHGFHTYPAGLHPDATRDLMGIFGGKRLLDPFCGGGTVLVEGRLAGMTVFGRDLSPVALRVARGRTASPDEDTVRRFRSAARKLADLGKAASRDGALPPEDIFRVVEDWYAPHAILELEALRAGVATADADIRPLLEIVFSSILIKTSWRQSDTSGQRKKHKRPEQTTSILFHKKARELGRRIEALREKVPPDTPQSDIAMSDARTVSLSEPVDLVLTSPPYPGTYDYVPMQHLRRAWFGEWDGDDQEIGSRRLWRSGERVAKKTWRLDTFRWTKSVAASMAKGGHFVVVIGDGLTPTGSIDSSEATSEAANAAGLTSVARASLERPDHARGSSRWEHVFAYRKD